MFIQATRQDSQDPYGSVTCEGAPLTAGQICEAVGTSWREHLADHEALCLSLLGLAYLHYPMYNDSDEVKKIFGKKCLYQVAWKKKLIHS
jgi:hypothetical protein